MTGPLDPDLLLAQSAWVRRLARTLVADDPTADDVLQDTMVAALEHPPRIGGPGNSLRAWLSTVARRLAHRRGRSDTRRDERERGAARPVEVPSVDHVLAIEGSRRKLVEHVLALDDLYRDAILLRYFDELSPAEIAHRIGVRDSTVRNRLRRGLALLHERLEREQGEHWRQWCLLLVPAGSSGTGSPAVSWTGASAGLFAMGTKLALLLVSVAAALATILGWRALAPNASPAIAVRPAPPVTTVARAPVEKVEAQAANVRGSQPVASAPAPEVAPVGILSFGAVRTREGQPVISGTVWIEDPIGRQRQCDLDARGWYSFAGLGPGAWTLRASCDGFRPFDLPVELSQDRSVERRDLTLDAAALLGVRIRVAPGKQTSSNPLGPRFTVVATRNVPSARLAETAARSHTRYGIGQYRESQPLWGRDERIPDGCDGLLTVDEPLPCCVSLVLRHLVIETQVVPAGAASVDFLVDPDAASKLLARARVRVVDAETGVPLHPANVALNPCDVAGGGVATDEEGVAELEGLLPGPLELEVTSKGHAWCQRTVGLEPSEMNDLGTLRVPRSCRVTGTVVDESGAPVSVGLTWFDAAVTDRPDRFRIFCSARSDSEGCFALERVPRGKLLLWSLPAELDWAHSCVAVDTSAGDVEGAVLRVERGRLVGLRFERADSESLAWLIRRSDGAAVTAQDWMPRGPIPLRLAEGAYRVEVWRDGANAGGQELRVLRDGEVFEVKR